jgi:Ca-activated chloride channel family protein
MIRWGAYSMLILVWLIIPLGWLLFHLRKRRETAYARLLDPDMLPVLAPGYSRKRVRTRMIIWLAALLLCLVALARPQWGYHLETVKRRGLDVMVLLDTSRSMLTQDIRPNRLQQAKWGIRDLVNKLHGDRVGLVTFAGSSFLQCPLTSDYAAFLMTLDDVYAGIIPRGGTAIGAALEKALESFEYEESTADKVIVLVTDGEDHEGDPARWIEPLKERGIRVYSIGVGTIQGELVPGADRNGYLKNQQGEVVKSALNETPLQQLAMATGGIYVRSAPGDFGLEQVYDHGIDQLQREELDSKTMRIYEERFMWFILAALLLLLGEALLARKVRLPIRAGTTTLTVILLFTGLLHSANAQGPQEYMELGLDTYDQADEQAAALADQPLQEAEQNEELQQQLQQISALYTQAAEAFSKAANLASEDKKYDPGEAYYNLGNAYFRLQQFDKADTAYRAALATQNLPLQSKVYYNLGNLTAISYSAETNKTFQGMIENLDHAMEHYEKSLLLSPADNDAKANYEMALRNKEMLIAARDYIASVIAQTKQLVKQGQFQQATALLQQFSQNQQAQQALSADQSSRENVDSLQNKVGEVLGVIEEARQAIEQLKNQAQEGQIHAAPDHGGSSQ